MRDFDLESLLEDYSCVSSPGPVLPELLPTDVTCTMPQYSADSEADCSDTSSGGGPPLLWGTSFNSDILLSSGYLASCDNLELFDTKFNQSPLSSDTSLDSGNVSPLFQNVDHTGASEFDLAVNSYFESRNDLDFYDDLTQCNFDLSYLSQVDSGMSELLVQPISSQHEVPLHSNSRSKRRALPYVSKQQSRPIKAKSPNMSADIATTSTLSLPLVPSQPVIFHNAQPRQVSLSAIISNSQRVPISTKPIVPSFICSRPNESVKGIPENSKAMMYMNRQKKNRESAFKSRQRQKNYVASLEARIAEQDLEIAQLRNQVQQLTALEVKPNMCATLPASSPQLQLLIKPASPSYIKGSVCLSMITLCLVFIFSLSTNSFPEMSPIALPSLGAPYQTNSLASSRRLLRVLESDGPLNLNSTYLAGHRHHFDESFVPELPSKGSNLNLTSTGCAGSTQAAINQTHSRKLARDISGALVDHRKLLSNAKLFDVIDSPSFRSLLSRRSSSQLSGSKFSKGSDYSTLNALINAFESIQRRDDTIYMVALGANEFFLPHLDENTTGEFRPKMSLVMPAMNQSNDDPRHFNFRSMNLLSGNLYLMQIDCEVTQTHFVQYGNATPPN